MEEGEGKGTIKEPNPLSQVPISALIEELGRRKLTKEETNALQSLRAEEPTDKSKTQNRELLPDGRATNAPQEITAPPEVVGKESQVEKFVKAIVRKNVNGKFPKGTMINGVEMEGGPGGFYDRCPDKKIPSDFLSWPLTNRLYRIANHAPESELRKTSVVDVSPSKTDSNNMVLSINFLHDTHVLDGRQMYTPMSIRTELSREVMTELVGEISKNPDLLEEFYQKAFVGLDSRDNSPGARRIKTNGFYLIQGKDLARAKELDSKRINDADAFRTFPKLQYKNGPYGAVD